MLLLDHVSGTFHQFNTTIKLEKRILKKEIKISKRISERNAKVTVEFFFFLFIFKL